jgi:toxin ParE1/3/4
LKATIRWTEPANHDFLGIIEWIGAANPLAARQVGRRILTAVGRLAEYPHLGRAGRSGGTRELVIDRLPYLVVYDVLDDPSEVARRQISILRVLHGAMLWPLE